MALTESASFIVSSVLSILTFSAMQMFKTQLASTQLMTILGGFIGSILFVFLLTAVGNLERTMFGKGFQTQIVETIFCLITSMFAAGSVHRVCSTVCLLSSLLMLYSMYKLSQETYGVTMAVPTTEKAKKKK